MTASGLGCIPLLGEMVDAFSTRYHPKVKSLRYKMGAGFGTFWPMGTRRDLGEGAGAGGLPRAAYGG